MLEAAFEFFLQVVARFLGVTVVALAMWGSSGFRTSYRVEWRRLFDRHDGAYSWIDILGLAVIVGGFAALALSVVFLLPALTG